MVLVLQTELSDRQMDAALLVRVQTNGSRTVPLCQQVERRQTEGEAGLQVGPHAMSHMLDVTDRSQHGEHRLYHYASVPSAALAHQHVRRVALLAQEAMIGEHRHHLLKLLNHWLKG